MIMMQVARMKNIIAPKIDFTSLYPSNVSSGGFLNASRRFIKDVMGFCFLLGIRGS